MKQVKIVNRAVISISLLAGAICGVGCGKSVQIGNAPILTVAATGDIAITTPIPGPIPTSTPEPTSPILDTCDESLAFIQDFYQSEEGVFTNFQLDMSDGTGIDPNSITAKVDGVSVLFQYDSVNSIITLSRENAGQGGSLIVISGCKVDNHPTEWVS